MDNNALIVQFVLDRQAELDALRARVAELERTNSELHQALLASTSDAQTSEQHGTDNT